MTPPLPGEHLVRGDYGLRLRLPVSSHGCLDSPCTLETVLISSNYDGRMTTVGIGFSKGCKHTSLGMVPWVDFPRSYLSVPSVLENNPRVMSQVELTR